MLAHMSNIRCVTREAASRARGCPRGPHGHQAETGARRDTGLPAEPRPLTPHTSSSPWLRSMTASAVRRGFAPDQIRAIARTGGRSGPPGHRAQWSVVPESRAGYAHAKATPATARAPPTCRGPATVSPVVVNGAVGAIGPLALQPVALEQELDLEIALASERVKENRTSSSRAMSTPVLN